MNVLKQMSDWKQRFHMEVSYPKGKGGTSKNSEASHQWFNGNKEISEDYKNLQPVLNKVIPKPEEELNAWFKENLLYKLEQK